MEGIREVSAEGHCQQSTKSARLICGNWSVGKRQLFRLGRVLLIRHKILVLDEATTSIDSATDTILQRIIREGVFRMHYCNSSSQSSTVFDNDFGHLVEYEEPSKLMETNSYFSKLVS
uniref:ABC transporter domain-containing protein n=1 Tax=Cucumis sativus TaxID=3659 RepID=A0A0A0K7I7_CUCSA